MGLFRSGPVGWRYSAPTGTVSIRERDGIEEDSMQFAGFYKLDKLAKFSLTFVYDMVWQVILVSLKSS